MEVKSMFPASNGQTSRLWRITNAICQRRELHQTQILASLGLNRPVIRWMSADTNGRKHIG